MVSVTEVLLDQIKYFKEELRFRTKECAEREATWTSERRWLLIVIIGLAGGNAAQYMGVL